MSITGPKFMRLACALMLGITVSLGASSPAGATTQTQQTHKKKKKVQQPPPPPLPSGPTGPVQQIPLDSIAAVPPQVSFQNNQLTIVAANSTLADILRAVRKQTGAEIDIPPAPDRVVTHLGPGPARAVVAELLNGSRFNYVLLGSPADDAVLTRVVLVAKSGPDVAPSPAGAHPAPAATQANNAPEDAASDAEAEASEENMNGDEAPPDQPAEPDQPANNGDQPAVKTPQQVLQEMQQRQMQLQQQQQQGDQVPGSGMPPHPPREQ
ncbi:MAG: hypothetical protein WCF26_20520 [Candidatus Sulfotelmatobacter sp.]